MRPLRSSLTSTTFLKTSLARSETAHTLSQSRNQERITVATLVSKQGRMPIQKKTNEEEHKAHVMQAHHRKSSVKMTSWHGHGMRATDYVNILAQ